MLGGYRTYCCGLLLLGLFSYTSQAQELRAEVEVRTDELGTAFDRSLVSSLEIQLRELLNKTSFTPLSYTEQERIEARFSLHIHGLNEQGEWKGDLIINARRPVYHSDYKTTTFLWKDPQLSFSYRPGEPLIFQGRDTDHPLVLLLSYYVYLILVNDLDSFSPHGGDQLIDQLRELADVGRAHADWLGWEALGKGSERLALLAHYDQTEGDSSRQAWYQYHRLGLDQLADTPQEARSQIMDAITSWSREDAHKHGQPWYTMLRETKLSEMISLFKGASSEEKAHLHSLLQELFPGTHAPLQSLQ